MPETVVLAKVTGSSELSGSAKTLTAIFIGIRAGQYSNYKNVTLTNRGFIDLVVNIVDSQFSAATSNSNALLAGESLKIPYLNTGKVYVTGDGSGNDILEFYGEADI